MSGQMQGIYQKQRTSVPVCSLRHIIHLHIGICYVGTYIWNEVYGVSWVQEQSVCLVVQLQLFLLIAMDDM